MKTYEDLKSVVQDNSSDVYCLSAEMIRLEVVQDAIAQLMERIDDIEHKGWDEDPTMARLSIGEIERKVRLIDMAFYPLFQKMKENIDKIEIHSSKLFDIVVKSETNNNEIKEDQAYHNII